MAAQPKLKEMEVEIRNMIDQIRRGSTNSLYEIAVRIKTITDNTVIYASQVGIPSRAVTQRLDGLLVDFNVTVETLLVVLKHRPHRDQWTLGINKMANEIAKEARAKARPSRPLPVKKKGYVQDLVAVSQQLNEEKQRAEQLCAALRIVNTERDDTKTKLSMTIDALTSRIDEKDKTITQLQIENRRLRDANERLLVENKRLRAAKKMAARR